MTEESSGTIGPMAGDEGVRVVWASVEELPLQPSNQFLTQSLADQGFISFGILTPPVVLGSKQDREEAIGKIDHLEVRPLARFALTRQAMVELANLLQRAVEKIDEQTAEPSQMRGEAL